MVELNRESEVVFTNPTDEDFDGRWNKKIYRVKAGKSYFLPLYLAEHIGKHLVDRELTNRANAAVAARRKEDPRVDSKEIERVEQAILGNFALRQELMDKCVEKTQPKDEDMEVIHPKEAPQEERIVLKTNQRSAELVESGKIAAGDLGPFNKPQKATEDEFEGK